MKKKLLAVALCAAMIFSTVQQVAIATGDFAADTSSVVSETVENESSGTESYPESPILTEETSTEESTEESETSTEESSEAETSQESSASETSETNTDEQTSNSGNKIESGLANRMNQLIKPLSAASLTSTYALVNPADYTNKDTSSIAAVYETEDDFKASAAFDYQDFAERYSSSIPMPGMLSSYTIRKSDSKRTYCRYMVPQGFCQASYNGTDYLIVSAYCDLTNRHPITGECQATTATLTHQHHSVLYVLKADGTYLTTIILNTYGHVGGICYDGKYLWYSISYDDKNKALTTAATTVDGLSLSAYTNSGSDYMNTTGVPKLIGGIKFNQLVDEGKLNSESVDTVNTTTYRARTPVNTTNGVTADVLAYDGTDIYVTRFVYPMNAISNDTAEARNPGYTRICKYYHKAETDFASDHGDIYLPCDRIQGMAFAGDYIIVARSYTRNPTTGSYISLIEFYWKNKTITVNGKTCQMPTGHCLVMPSMIEGVAYYNNKLYVTFESPASKFSDCASRVDRIVALDISGDLAYLNADQPEYTRVIDLGMIRPVPSSTVDVESDGYEQVILDDSYSVAVDGAIYKYNASSGQKVYCYNSKVNNGEKLLVRLHDGFDLVNTAKTSSGTTYTGEGFKVASGGTLEIRSVQSINMTGGYTGDTDTSTPADKAGEVVIRRNAFGSQTYNSTFTAAVVTAESGATVKITSQNPVSGKGKHAQVVFKGGTSNYVECTDAMVNISGGSCYMDGVTFRQIQGTTTNTHTAFRATGDYTADGVQIINRKFEDIYPVHSTTETGDGAAVFFDKDYNSPITLLENCTFDNSYDHSDFDEQHPHDPTLAIANPVYYAAVRYDGGVDEIAENTNDVEFKNLTFKNFANTKNAEGTIAEKTAPRKGIIGFSNINWSDDTCTRTPKQLRNITVEGITMQNCETRDSDHNKIKLSGQTVEETHYDGPLTFAKKIQNVDIKGNVLFENCKAWGAGAIAFDIDSVIDNVSITGSGVDRNNSANTNGTVKFVN